MSVHREVDVVTALTKGAALRLVGTPESDR